MLLAPAVLALLFTPDLSAVSARFGTPAMVLRGDSLQLTPDGKLATDGETWIDLATEKVVPAPMPGVGRRLQLLLGDGNFVLEEGHGFTRHSGKTGERLSTVDTGDGRSIDPSGRKLARKMTDQTGSRVELADWPSGDKPPAWSTLATSAGRIGFMVFNPSGTHLIWTQSPPRYESGGTTAWVCDVSTGKAVRLQRNPARGNLAGLAVSGDGKLATVISAADTDVFDAATGEFLRSAPHPERRPHTGYGYPYPVFTPDGKHLLACGLHGGKLSRIPTDPKAEVVYVDVSDGDDVEKFGLTPDGKRAAVLDKAGVVRVYDVGTGKRADAGTNDTWRGVAWAGEHQAVCWSDRGRVVVWDTRTGKAEKDWVIGRPAVDSEGVWGVKASGDGKRLAVIESAAKAERPRLRVHDLGTGKVVWELPGEYHPFAVAFHPDGERIGVNTLEPRRDQERERAVAFRTFSMSSGREGKVAAGLRGEPAFTADGRAVVTLTTHPPEDGLSAWVGCAETATGGPRWTWKGVWDDMALFSTECVGTTPDGTPFAAFGSTVRGFNPLTGKTVWEIEGSVGVKDGRHYAASPDGRWLATTAAVEKWEKTGGGWFELYDLSTPTGRARPLVSPVVPGTTFRGVAVSADGGRVVTLGVTGEQMVWGVGKLRQAVPDPWQTVWADLGTEAGRAIASMAALVADPERAVKLLAEKLPPVAEPNVAVVKRWLGELGSPDFKTRDTAERALNEVLDTAPALIRAAADKPVNAEAGERLERLMASIDHLAKRPDSLRVVRAVEVVERIRTPAAVKLLEQWASGAPDALLTTEAKASLRRIKK